MNAAATHGDSDVIFTVRSELRKVLFLALSVTLISFHSPQMVATINTNKMDN